MTPALAHVSPASWAEDTPAKPNITSADIAAAHFVKELIAPTASLVKISSCNLL
jgi:hypothetical protein